MVLLAALLFGVVAGLRTFTGEAVYFALRGVLGVVFPVLALVEYAGDALPQAPSRTALPSVLFRCVSGAFMGWTVARSVGAVLGVVGALFGTFGGHRFRVWLIVRIGAIPAALLEDVIAIALAFACVALLRR